MHGPFLVKRIVLSDRAKPSWTVTDSCGRHVFEERRDGHTILSTLALKRDAKAIADYCRAHGVASALAEFKRRKAA